MALQPAVAYFGTTDQETSPLMLFVGREYNNESNNDVHGVGLYSFADSPRSAFWNKTYGLTRSKGGKSKLKNRNRRSA
jgi:hypothetical protein